MSGPWDDLVVPVKRVPLEEAKKVWPPKPFVVVACPIRNREWAVRPFLDSVVINAEREPQAVLFVTGDNEDVTIGRLIGEGVVPDGDKLAFEVFDTDCSGWHRSGEPRYSVNDHAALADVYNHCIDTALERWPEATHIWMIDSDVNPEPDVLGLLLEADKDIISAVVRNSPGALNFMCGHGSDGEPRRSRVDELSIQRAKVPFRVEFLSACTLFRREVLEGWHNLGPGRDDFEVRYAPDPRSHDFPLVAAAKAAGYGLFVEPRARTRHFFSGPDEEPLR